MDGTLPRAGERVTRNGNCHDFPRTLVLPSVHAEVTGDFRRGRRRDPSAPGWVCESVGSAPSVKDLEPALDLQEPGLSLHFLKPAGSPLPFLSPSSPKDSSLSASLCGWAAVMVTLIMVIRKEKSSSMFSVSSLPGLCKQDRCTCIEIPALKASAEGTRLELGRFSVVLVKARVAYENVLHPSPRHIHTGPHVTCTCSHLHRHA